MTDKKVIPPKNSTITEKLFKYNLFSENQQKDLKNVLCELYLQEIKKMDAGELATYLEDITFDKKDTSINLLFKFKKSC